jgi:hypothetical protein
VYEGLRKKGMSKERAARIANTPDASKKGVKSSGGGSKSSSGGSKTSSGGREGSGGGGKDQQKAKAGRKGGKKSS